MIAFYFIPVVLVALWSLAYGFRQGISFQVASLLGMAFGAVAARILSPELESHFQWATNLSHTDEFGNFAPNLVCSAVIYFVVFWLFALLAPLLKMALAMFRVGILNRIAGSLFCLLKNLLWLSIFFNLILCFSAPETLLRFEKANDGNLVAAVMALTPGILGCYGAADFAHFNQLKEAKSISCNFKSSNYVILSKPKIITTSTQC